MVAKLRSSEKALPGVPTAGPTEPAAILLVLNRAALVRLRHYFGRYHYARNLQGDGPDLDLIHHGLVARREINGVTYHEVSELGERVLGLSRQQDIENRKPHHDLGSRLALWLVENEQRTTWENVEFRVDAKLDGVVRRESLRPDVFSLVASYEDARVAPVVHEVKVTRADFLADVAAVDKRSLYWLIADKVSYVAPKGLISSGELPDDCGLVEEGAPGVFTVVKRAKRHRTRVPYTTRQWMNLVLKPHQKPRL